MGLEPLELLHPCLVAHIQDLPFEQGKPLSPIEEETTGDFKIVDCSDSHDSLPDRQIYMMIGTYNLGPDAARYAMSPGTEP